MVRNRSQTTPKKAVAKSPYTEHYQKDPLGTPAVKTDRATKDDQFRAEQRKVHRDAHRANQRLHNPQSLSDYFDFGKLYEPQFDMKPFSPAQDRNVNDFVKQVENAFLGARGKLPMAWLLAQDPEDIALMRPEIAERLFEMQEVSANKEAESREENRQINLAIKAEQNVRSTLHGGWNGMARAGGTESVGANQLSFEERTQIAQDVRDKMRGNVTPLEVVPGFKTRAESMAFSGMKYASVALEFVLRGAISVSPAARALYETDAFGLRSKQEGILAEERAHVKTLQELPDEMWVDRAGAQTGEEAWAALELDNPEEHQRWVELGGNPFTAAAMFIDAFTHEPTVREQLRKIVEDPESGYKKDLEEFADTLEESDYRVGSAMLDGLAVLGKYPMHWATGAAVLLTDDDIRTEVLDNQWHTLWEEVAKHDGAPSSVFNIDGTIAGLGLDLAAGIIFDPTTWIFGPTGLGMLARVSSRAGVTMTLAGRGLKRSIHDSVRLASSDAHGIAPLAMTLNTFEEVGMMGEALDLLKAVDQTLPGRPYLHADARALAAQDTATPSVLRMLDPEDVKKLDAIPDEVAIRARESLKETGFDQVVEINYATEDGTLHLNSSDLLRVRAARDLNLRGVPVTIRMTNTMKKIVQSEERAALAAAIRSNPNDYVFRGSVRWTKDRVDEALRGEGTQPTGGLSRNQARAEEYAGNRDQGLQFATPEGAEDWVLVYRKDSFGDDLQEHLATRDLEESYRASEGGPRGFVEESEYLARTYYFEEGAHPTPVFAYRPSQGMDGVPIGPEGVRLDSLNDGRQVPKSMTGLEPNVGDQVYVKPDLLFPREFTLGKDVAQLEAGLTALYKKALLRGASPPQATRWATAAGWNERIKEVMSRADWLESIERYNSPQHTISHFDLRGVGATQKLTETTVRIWGRNQERVELWLNRIYDWERRTGASTSAYFDDLAKLAPDHMALKALEDLQGGGWDNSMRLLDDPVDALAGIPPEALANEAAFVKFYDDLTDRVHAAEKKSDPATWTADERAAYDAGDTKSFSELRGYTPEEIADHQLLQELHQGMEPVGQRPYPAGSPNEGSLAAVGDPQDIYRELSPSGRRDPTMRRLEAGATPVESVISGGQTGADIGGLRAARGAGMETGGTAPRGFRTEEGANMDLRELGLTESQAANYQVRTVQNVQDADATIIFDPANSTGSRQTLQAAENAGKPVLVVRTQADVQKIDGFLRENNVKKLNVAGNRESVTPGIGGRVERTLGEQFRSRQELNQARANRVQLQEQVATLSARLGDDIARMDAVHMNTLPDVRELAQIMEDMYEDFSRIEITPQWEGKLKPDGTPYVDPASGRVSWDDLRRGLPDPPGATPEARRFMSDEMVKAGEEAGENAEEIFNRLSGVNKELMSWNAPMSPLDLVVASRASGATWTRYTHIQAVSSIRKTAHLIQEIWILDKVMSPGTAMRVSLDEVTRIFHRYGHEGAWAYFRARADLNAARATGFFQKGRAFGRDNVRLGATKRSPAAQERLRVLKDEPVAMNQAERTSYDKAGVGYEDIAPSDPIYADAAPRWTGSLLQDTATRAYLRGEDAFREWFFGADGLRMRQATVQNGGTSHLLTSWKDAFDGWHTFFDTIVLHQARKNGVYADVRAAWVDTASKIDAQGGRALDPPAIVLENLGTIRGVKKHAQTNNLGRAVSDRWMDSWFMDPVNYRRSILGQLARKIEYRRLRRLMNDQPNMKIVSDLELENMLAFRGMGLRTGAQDYIYKVALDQGLVPEGYLWQLADNRALAEIDNVLYTWDQGSRMGRSSKALFPFGRPWADMAGFWSREALSRPALRGWLNNTNFMNVNKIANWVADHSFNPKPGMTISRLAATDFSLERPFGDDGPSMDFGPLLFMPTGGDNPFGAILPGLGYLPMAIIDQVLKNKYDPVDQPVEYQNLLESISEIIPALRFNTGGNPIASGTIGTGLNLLQDIFGALSGASRMNLARMTGDISREIDRARQVSVLLTEPGTLEELLAITDPEELDAQLAGLITQANQKASLEHGVSTMFRWGSPVRGDFHSAVEDLQEVWIEAAARFPDDLKADNPNPRNDDEKRQAADDIRRQFFGLEQWKRDLYIAQYPELAVNLISSWEWHESAKNVVGREALNAYRTSGTTEGLAQHQAYIQNGLIQPRDPTSRLYMALGLMQASKVASARRLYELTAKDRNEKTWEFTVSPASKAYLEQLLATPWAKSHGYRTAHQLWEKWGTAEKDLEEFLAHERGVDTDPNSDAYKDIKALIGGIPSDERPWGTTFPGMTEAAGSAQFRDLRLPFFTEEVQEIANGLGVDLEVGMSGIEFLRTIQGTITDTQTAVYDLASGPYRDYVDSRSVLSRAAEDSLRTNTLGNMNLAPEFRDEAKAFFRFVDNLEYRTSGDIENPFPTLAESQEVARKFNMLEITRGESHMDWDRIWKERYEKRFGPRDWTAPSPAPVFLENGKTNPHAYQPYIESITDGDSLVVSTRIGAATMFTPSTASGGGRDERAQSRVHNVRLLGVMAAEWNTEDGPRHTKRLRDALMEAQRTGAKIWLVRDPQTFGSNTDAYGRELAWLWIGDKPYFFEGDFLRSVTPSGDGLPAPITEGVTE